MYLKINCIIILLLSYVALGSAQTCQGFYKNSRCNVKKSAGFKQYGQAKSAAVEVGKSYKCAVVLYGKKDYIISVCSEVEFKRVHFKVLDKTNNELIYDNEEDNYLNAIAFSIEKTSNVEIEVEVLDDKDDEKDPENYRVCIGVQILWRKIPALGFKE